jgi:outer membrane protein assembly factor BamB
MLMIISRSLNIPAAVLAVVATTIVTAGAHAGDWPMWRCDAGHTAASPHALPDQLQLHWTRQYTPREPVWDDPLNRDMMPYDSILEPVVADNRMLLAFNDADKLVALDVRDGSELWTFYTDGPVRFSPVVYQDSVFVCSDDGYLYCLTLADGVLRWRFRGGPSERKVLGNRRVISSWPARGGPVVADDTVYFAASIWPFMGTFIYALDAASGAVRWQNDETGYEYQKQPHSAPSYAGVAPQGQLAVGGDLLLVPGGRSLPAGFDRHTGQLRFFDFGGKGQGGSFVAADGSRAFVHTRRRGTIALQLPGGKPTKFSVNEPVLSGGLVYAADNAEGPSRPVVVGYDADDRQRWQVDVDGSGDLIQAGDRLYAAGAERITAIQLAGGDRKPKIAWSLPVDGQVLRLVAAADRLFAVTGDGRIMAFGAGSSSCTPISSAHTQPEIDPQAAERARRLLAAAEHPAGYALWFGVEDEQLLRAVVAAAGDDLQVVAVDPDANRVDRLRREFDAAGWYGRRVSVHVGTPRDFLAPPYITPLVVVDRPLVAELTDADQLIAAYRSVRPYGGRLWLQTDADDAEPVARRVGAAELEQAAVAIVENAVVVTREGALPGAADWTHAYGDVANTVKSNDSRVRLPLGLLWFGGPSNLDILPRHGHGPSEQVVGGRLFIQGMNSLNAWDVYTGRVLWKRQFQDLGTYQVYYDETYADTPLSTAYNQVHIPGATARGTNYVATPDGVYLVIGDRCLLLDTATGRTLREFVLPAGPDGQTRTWGYVGVYEDLLLAGVDFADFSGRLGYEYTPAGKKGVAWGPDHSASLGLAAFDRATGQVRWQIPARHSLLHNGIVAGGGRIYLLDKLPRRVEEQNQRRGWDHAATYRVLAVDAQTGEAVWSRQDDAFGTWLSYSAEHDLLLQAGAAATDRSPDETSQGLAVYRGSDGATVWENRELSYAGPCILHGDTIITNTTSYRESKGAYSLLDGSPITIADPVTGASVPWCFSRAYGCNTAVASEHLLTFRSGAAGFYDLASHGGTGNFGGFKSGCTSNLIVADGVLSAPDYTRTCTCGYQNQTSLAMVPMPENEIWLYNVHGRSPDQEPAIQRIGLNLGAPGDRLAADGTLWVNHPPDEGTSPRVDVRVQGDVQWFCDHSSRVSGPALPWVAASGAEGIHQLTVRLAPPAADPHKIRVPVRDPNDDAEEAATGEVSLDSSDLELTRDQLVIETVPAAASGTAESAALEAQRQVAVRLVFIEPDAAVQAGERVFDVALQGQTVVSGLDIAARAGAGRRSLVLAWDGIAVGDLLQVTLTPRSDRPPVLSGVEIVPQ